MSIPDRSPTRRKTVRQYAAPRRVAARLQPSRWAPRPDNGTPVKVIVSDQPAVARRAMSTGAGISLITVGAILLFALTAGASPQWINLHIVGIILILSGVLGLTLPRLKRSSGSGFRRWVVPMLPSADEPPPADEPDLLRRPDASNDYPTLADEILGDEHDPPTGDR
jgi:hypothetical protein